MERCFRPRVGRTSHRLTGITQGANAVGFTYDAASRRTQATLPNGVTIDYAWDNANQLTGLNYKRNGLALDDLNYTYDAAGRRKTLGGSFARVNLPPAMTSATYDVANKLNNWAGTILTYDNNGNLTYDGSRTHTWDSRDRLTGLNGGGIASSNTYDAFDRRISRTLNGTQIGTVHDGLREVHTATGSTIDSTLLNGPGLDERYASTQGGNTNVILPDALGSTLHLVSPGGSLTASYTYEPYGTATQSGPDNTQYQYTGREDDGTALMYYRARYYNPRIGRFISEDPIGLTGGVNLFGYADEAPTNKSDPLGLWSFTMEGYGGVGGGVTVAYNAGTFEMTGRVGVGVGGGISFDPKGMPSDHARDTGSGYIARTTATAQVTAGAGVGTPRVSSGITASSGNAFVQKQGGGFVSSSIINYGFDGKYSWGIQGGATIGVEVGSYTNWGAGCR